jgi:hypothetical protein
MMPRMRGTLILIALAACGPKLKDGDGGPDAACTDPSCTQQACAPGTVEDCYDGPGGTAGIGPCTGGTRTCSDLGLWSACDGQIVPIGELCANGVDDNCNGQMDEDADLDGDGFTTCGGDCCDAVGDGCATPALVNPGAFEAMGNTVDDDCDGQIDNVLAASCDAALASNSADGFDYARAMDLCQTATAQDNKWGVISARFAFADGSGAPNAAQHAIRTAFGQTLVQGGSGFAVLSTGNAATPSQTNPGYRNFQTGAPIGTSSPFPNDYITTHGGALPNAPGCPAPAGDTANDPVMLELQIRTPTNAKSFSFSLNFLSSEFPEWTCSPFNDFFVVLLDSTFNGSPANPADKNLAFYKNGANQVFPVGVNLAAGDTGLFTSCENGPTGCTSPQSVAGTISTCTNAGVDQLIGTGFDQADPPPHADATGQPGYCGINNLLGGGTGWLTTTGNVRGGEVIKLRIALWDTTDGIYDSVAIVDNFVWSVEASQPGTVLEKPTH